MKRPLRAGIAIGMMGALGFAAYFFATAKPAPPHSFFSAKKRATEVIAHRGGAALRPENTLVAFDHAARLGADILEMDIRLTADGELVVIHDATVERTTNGSGAVAGMSLRGLQSLDAGYWFSADSGKSFPYRGQGLRIPALKEVFATQGNMRLVLEIKSPGEPAATALCTLIRGAGMASKALVATFDVATIEHFRRACPEVATALAAAEARSFVVAAFLYLAGATRPAAPALLIPDRLGRFEIASDRLIATARGRGLKVQVWAVNDEARMRELIAARVDGIMTDRPDLLLASRARR